MEIRAFAELVLCSTSLDEKLKRHQGPWSDDAPGEPLHLEVPGRPDNLQFAPPRAAPGMPKPGAFVNREKVAMAHHIMANHELQACEVMAYILCAFPDAPADFRLGMTHIIGDEQRHTRMHIERASQLGLEFGSLPVNCYIWKKALEFQSVLDYLAGLPLVFEGRNLDHSLEFESYFRKAGDEKSASLMRIIHDDEIEHVAFGMTWLRKLKPDHLSDWEAFEKHLHWPLRPAKAKGDQFDRASREAAGMSSEFIDQLADLDVEPE